MWIFGKERQTLRIKKIRAATARVAFLPEGMEEIDVDLITDDGDRLTLQIPHRRVPELIGQLTDTYEAINVPLSRRHNWQAQWDGSDNQS